MGNVRVRDVTYALIRFSTGLSNSISFVRVRVWPSGLIKKVGGCVLTLTLTLILVLTLTLVLTPALIV